jgi:hypothetical protein
MLSSKTQTNLGNAKGYFEEHLCVGDYYAENCQGIWMEGGANLLGLEGTVAREAFLSPCKNRHFASGKRLRQRQKTTRMGKAVGSESTNRRVFFDFTISPPKSVSNATLVVDDSRIAAHREAVSAAVSGLEGFTSARLPECGANRDRRTGNIAAGPVEASDALRRSSATPVCDRRSFGRSDDKFPIAREKAEERERIRIYREAVNVASTGDLVTSLEHLERLGALKECSIDEQREHLREAYPGFATRGETAVVVSQARVEMREINEAVRAGLRRGGTLRGADTSLTAMEQIDLTTAQKADTRYYPAESSIVFNREFRGCLRGSSGPLVAVTLAGILVEVDARIKRVPQKCLDRITVCPPMPPTVCSGDTLQLKANALARHGERLVKGEIATLSVVLLDGSIRLADGRRLSPSYRRFQRGYAVTFRGSRGKTVGQRAPAPRT